MIPLPTLRIAAAAAALAAAFAAGWWVAHQKAEARVQSLLAVQAQRDRQAAELLADAERRNTQRLQAALTAADAAVALAQSREATARQTLETTRAELIRVTSASRACLSAAAVRVLNASATAPGGSGLRLPTATASAAGPAAEPAAAAAGYASEQAVAGWIAQAQQMYDTCRARVDALAQWARGVHPPQEARP